MASSLDLDKLIVAYCTSSTTYPDLTSLRSQLNRLSNPEKILLLQNECHSSKTVLWWAASRNDSELVTLFLTSLPSEDRLTTLLIERYRPLDVAAGLGNTETVSSILGNLTHEHQWCLVFTEAGEDGTVLHKASVQGHTPTVKTVLEYFTPEQQLQLISVKNMRRKTAMQSAAEQGHADTRTLLREYVQQAENLINKTKQDEKVMQKSKPDARALMNRLITENKKLQEQNLQLLQMNEKLSKTQADISLLLLERKGKSEEAELAGVVRKLLDSENRSHYSATGSVPMRSSLSTYNHLLKYRDIDELSVSGRSSKSLTIYSLQSIQSSAPSIYSNQSALSKSSFATPLPLTLDHDASTHTRGDPQQNTNGGEQPPTEQPAISAQTAEAVQQPDDDTPITSDTTSDILQEEHTSLQIEAVQPDSESGQQRHLSAESLFSTQQPADSSGDSQLQSTPSRTSSAAARSPISRFMRLFSQQQPSSSVSTISVITEQPLDNSPSL